MVIIYTVMHSD